MAAPLSVEVEFGGHPEPPGLDQEEFAKRAAGAVHPGRQCDRSSAGAGDRGEGDAARETPGSGHRGTAPRSGAPRHWALRFRLRPPEGARRAAGPGPGPGRGGAGRGERVLSGGGWVAEVRGSDVGPRKPG
ncbi:ubiquitin-related modifier 1 isoform X2 [Pipistrellus kuhlii]|uniref:ubiquitin-related modifier 1 isoform X2 n=1 Tax=Pipistrellus kuhlii TaxID=59472 RepID=UPI001E26FE9F|nr:ubiquitin-related modifier 1 isoform X2 [Pipistrellus kuhlii]